MKILLTGFEPFNKDKTNSSWEIAKAIPQEDFFGHSLIKVQLAVSFQQVGKQIQKLIESCHPNIILMLGQSVNTDKIRLERVALNFEDAQHPDNDDFCPDEVAILKDSPAAYFSSFPLKPLLKDLTEKGFSAVISNTAGTYVCNCVFYQALHICQKIWKHKGWFYTCSFN